jgi:hypothetical protein
MGTRSASGNQTLGAGSNSAIAAAPCPQPTINTISGYPTAVFAPEPTWNPYTIKGCGFGDQPGNVYLTGPFNAGKIKLQVQTVGNARLWIDTAIVVSLDPQLSGEVDQVGNVTLVVEPAAGPPIQKAGNGFFAVPREEVLLQQIPQSAVKFSQPASLSTSKGPILAPALTVLVPDLLYFSPAQVPPGMTAEVFRGGTTSFFPAGSDYFDFSKLARDFEITHVQLYQEADPTGCDSGNAGFLGSWSMQYEYESRDNIRVTWKEFRCHMAFMGPNDPDVWSDYALSVWVKGPRGVDPWTGKRIPQTMGLAPH